MSRKDYILIAETIKALTSFTTTNPACDDAVRFSVIVNQFADALAGTNPALTAPNSWRLAMERRPANGCL
jgi:hypothetical protein